MQDPEGNESIVRFSRKSKEQYVMTEIEGKASGWTARYVDGVWQEEQTKKKATKKTAEKEKA